MSKSVEKIEIGERDSSSTDDIYVKPLDKGYKDLGYISAVFLCVNRMVGTGVFATSSSIFTLCNNSVGLSLILWVIGSLIALAGLYVYMEFGSAIPRNGGEKNYLEYVYTKPKFFVTSLYSSYILLLGWASGNAIVAGQYILVAAEVEPTRWSERGIGIAVVTWALLANGIYIKFGAYVQNVLGSFKIAIILVIVVTGWVSLGGWKKTDNYHDSFGTAKGATAYGVVNALYNVIWSFVGYSNANYALGEIKNPVKTLKYAAPAALIVIAILYLFVNIAYFALVPKEVIVSSKTILAANFFEVAFENEKATKFLSAVVAISAIGNVMSVLAGQGRIVNSLGRSGIIPFSRLFASSKPFNSPFFGFLEHWVICVITIVAPPPGDAYNFILNLISYPLNIVNFFVGLGLLYLNVQKIRGKIEWNAPLKATIPVTIFFTLSSLYLVVAPYVPPTEDQKHAVYESLPYWIHCVTAWGIFGIGFVYWALWTQVLPRIGNYSLQSEEVLGEDGFWFTEIKKIPNDEYVNHIAEQGSFDAVDSAKL
ncbi:hypothetical protein WICMUC_002683 [Wickerhamomyces mucosus]|uniref:High affinity methionine permease n=1 Tax=Wickerhamomyces mucosus TaxID=1378264 RepID=A0A9P8PPX9_9ASCO|nr:hypothetical protein WICMUC_002683 [Wickerhamomyces mucosus]